MVVHDQLWTVFLWFFWPDCLERHAGSLAQLEPNSKWLQTLWVFRVRPRCRPWPPKRDFGGTPLSTEWFTHLPTKLGLPSVRCRQWKKYGYLDRRKTELEYILLSYCWKPLYSRLFRCSYRARLCDSFNLLTERFEMPVYYYYYYYYASALKGRGIKRCFCLTSLRRLSVWRLSVAYIGPNSRTERPRKTKIGTEVAHVTCDSDTTFKVKRSKVNLLLTS